MLDRLKKDVFKTLNQVKSSINLRYYKTYFKKIDLYRDNIIYKINM